MWNIRQPQQRPDIIDVARVTKNSKNPLSIEKDEPLAVGESCSGDVLLAVGVSAGLKIFNVRELTKPIYQLYKPGQSNYGKPFLWAAFDRNCNFITAKSFRSVYIWDLRTPEASPICLSPFNHICTSIAFNWNSHSVALGLVDMRTESETDQQMKANALVDGAILIYDLTQPDIAATHLNGPKGDVTATAFSPDSHILAAGTSNGKIAVFRLMTPQLSPIVLNAHVGPVLFLAFERKGVLLSVGADRTVRSWIVDTDFLAKAVGARVTRSLSDAEWTHYVGEDIPYEYT